MVMGKFNGGFENTQGAGNLNKVNPDKVTNYQHKHLYDVAGNPLDVNGYVVDYKSLDAHIPLE